MNNKTLLISVAIFFVLGFIAGTQMHGCRRAKSDDEHTFTIHSDTVTRLIQRTDTLYKSITTYIPLPLQIHAVKQGSRDTAINSVALAHSLCTDTVLYSDSIYRAREFKAIISDIITGNRIARRSIQWADLTPMEVQTITHTNTIDQKQPLLKVYLGAAAGLRYAAPLVQGGIDIAPAAALVFSDRYMLDMGYYILGSEITAGVKVKLSFKK